MNILLGNDDGAESEGIKKLAEVLSKKHNVMIVAPDGNRSAASHSLSIFKNLKIIKTDSEITTYTVSGTPADCIKFAHHELSKEFPIDLVVSGINKGHNLGTDVLYSGTVSAAFEGAALGYKSMAFSCTSHTEGDYDFLAEVAAELIEKLYDFCDKKYIWNVNIPPLKPGEIKGVKYTPLGRAVYSDNYKKISDNEYILVGEMQASDLNPEDCDVEWSRKGYITVTPLIYDKTDYFTLEKVKNL